MSINAVSALSFAKEIQEIKGTHETEPGAQSFGSYLNHSISDVNQMLHQADRKNVEVAVGRSENLHEAMITFEKAETALKLLTQVRNKAIEAYHEIMRMQT